MKITIKDNNKFKDSFSRSELEFLSFTEKDNKSNIKFIGFEVY